MPLRLTAALSAGTSWRPVPRWLALSLRGSCSTSIAIPRRDQVVMAASQNLKRFLVGFYTRSGANCSAVGSAQQYQGSLKWGIGSRLRTPVATSAYGSLGVVP